MTAYDDLCRDLIHAQGHPESFRLSDVTLTNGQLAVALEYHDHILSESAERARNEILVRLSVDPDDASGMPVLVGRAFMAEVRRHIHEAMRLDLETMALTMADEARLDNEFAREAV